MEESFIKVLESRKMVESDLSIFSRDFESNVLGYKLGYKYDNTEDFNTNVMGFSVDEQEIEWDDNRVLTLEVNNEIYYLYHNIDLTNFFYGGFIFNFDHKLLLDLKNLKKDPNKNEKGIIDWYMEMETYGIGVNKLFNSKLPNIQFVESIELFDKKIPKYFKNKYKRVMKITLTDNNYANLYYLYININDKKIRGFFADNNDNIYIEVKSKKCNTTLKNRDISDKAYESITKDMIEWYERVTKTYTNYEAYFFEFNILPKKEISKIIDNIRLPEFKTKAELLLEIEIIENQIIKLNELLKPGHSIWDYHEINKLHEKKKEIMIEIKKIDENLFLYSYDPYNRINKFIGKSTMSYEDIKQSSNSKQIFYGTKNSEI